MKHQITYLHCGEHLKESLNDEIDEVVSVVDLIEWEEEFKVIKPDSTLLHQTAYNKRFEIEFEKLGWEKKPLLSKKPRLIGDFRKNLVFVEVYSLGIVRHCIEISTNFSMDFRMVFYH